MFNNFFFRNSCRLWDNVEKFSGAKWNTNDVTIWRIRVACWISKATCTRPSARARTHTHTNTWYSLLFRSKSGYVNAPHCYVIRTLPLLMYFNHVMNPCDYSLPELWPTYISRNCWLDKYLNEWLRVTWCAVCSYYNETPYTYWVITKNVGSLRWWHTDGAETRWKYDRCVN